jgi:hypothetical protein
VSPWKQIEAGQAGSVFIPVVADIIGVATITVKARTQLSADRVKRELIVEAEGKTMHFNVPMIINEHTSVNVPLSFPPTFVADSQKVQISAIGTIIKRYLNLFTHDCNVISSNVV